MPSSYIIGIEWKQPKNRQQRTNSEMPLSKKSLFVTPLSLFHSPQSQINPLDSNPSRFNMVAKFKRSGVNVFCASSMAEPLTPKDSAPTVLLSHHCVKHWTEIVILSGTAKSMLPFAQSGSKRRQHKALAQKQQVTRGIKDDQKEVEINRRGEEITRTIS